MSFKKGLILTAFTTLSIGWTYTNLLAGKTGSIAQASEPAKKEEAKKMSGQEAYEYFFCHTCHGKTGNEPISPTYPKIAGQNAPYLEAQINDITHGKRTNGLSSTMKATVASRKNPELTEAYVKEIAQWLSKQGK